MNRGIALLLLGAILLVVGNLVGENGAVSNVAAMDKDSLSAVINDTERAGSPATVSAMPASESPADAGMVEPMVAEDLDTVEDDTERAVGPSDTATIDSGAAEGEINTTSFDPRIG